MMWDDVERRRPLARPGQTEARRTGSLDERQLFRLTSALLDEATQADGELQVTVTRQTGTVELRISAKNARRRLVFQGLDVHPTHIRQAVREALESYGPSLVSELKDDLARLSPKRSLPNMSVAVALAICLGTPLAACSMRSGLSPVELAAVPSSDPTAMALAPSFVVPALHGTDPEPFRINKTITCVFSTCPNAAATSTYEHDGLELE
jgi:hypothetical protein